MFADDSYLRVSIRRFFFVYEEIKICLSSRRKRLYMFLAMLDGSFGTLVDVLAGLEEPVIQLLEDFDIAPIGLTQDVAQGIKRLIPDQGSKCGVDRIIHNLLLRLVCELHRRHSGHDRGNPHSSDDLQPAIWAICSRGPHVSPLRVMPCCVASTAAVMVCSYALAKSCMSCSFGMIFSWAFLHVN